MTKKTTSADEASAASRTPAAPSRKVWARRTLCGGLALQRDSDVSLQDQIFAFFREAIIAGRFRRGRRLPSSRELAEEFAISRTTVVDAYERLVAEGYAESRPRAGLFVSEVLPEEFFAGKASRAAPQREVAAKSPGEAPDYQLPLAPGVPAIDCFPWAVWSKLSAEVARTHSARMIGWADPQGELPLREAIVEYLGTARGITCNADQVIVTSGSRPIVETAGRILAAPGDAVWCEEPGDPAPRAVIASLGLRPIPVPVDAYGMDVQKGQRLAASARIALVASSHHYPLGVTMSPERRRALLDWATTHRAWIVENEIDGDYRFVKNAQPPLYALDTAERTIFVGSFNKTLAPGLRIGYAVLPPSLVPAFAGLGPMVGAQQQLLLARFWAEGHFVAHLRYLREVHARRREVLLEALQEAAHLIRVPDIPEAGLRLPVSLKQPVCDVQVARDCLAQGIRVGRPFSACYAGTSRQSGFSLGFASTPEEHIRPGVQTLARIISAQRVGE